MAFLPSVESGKFKLKKAFQSGKVLACTKKSMRGCVSLFLMHALL